MLVENSGVNMTSLILPVFLGSAFVTPKASAFWSRVASTPSPASGTETGAQIWPQQFDVEGFFVACFRKGAAVSADGNAADGEGDGWAKFLGISP